MKRSQNMSDDINDKKLHGNKGKKRTPEQIEKMSNALKGKKRKPFSEETRRRMSESAKVKIFSPEHRKHLSEAFSGDKNPNYGGRYNSPVGSKNPMFGVHLTGDKNPMFGKRGKDNPNYGLKRSDETRGKIRQSKLKYYEDPKNREKLKQIRSNQVLPMKDSSIEVKLQEILQLYDIPFNKHKSFKMNDGSYHQVDLFIEPSICIEADGIHWHNFPHGTERDRVVNESLTQSGYIVLRFWEHEINSNIELCLGRMAAYIIFRGIKKFRNNN